MGQEISVENAILVIFKQIFSTKKVQNSTDYFWKKNFDEYHRYFLFDLTQILISKKFVTEIVFKSSVLAWIRNRIRIEQKCWIRIRIKSIRIHNPGM
jgi:hypothetical protein